MQYAVCSYWLLKTLNEVGVIDFIIRLKRVYRTLIFDVQFCSPGCLFELQYFSSAA